MLLFVCFGLVPVLEYDVSCTSSQRFRELLTSGLSSLMVLAPTLFYKDIMQQKPSDTVTAGNLVGIIRIGVDIKTHGENFVRSTQP